ncbi:Bromodomain and WD repeat-containing protein 1 [Choanephora cucurbitarum]|uniref:Bromodomain and WD repeat-containing protein 1 n=1 Tax=Choanephora cucurbitarum TaxID=101091 RepID=A0A1C7N4S0_9FUNG|nr:Bromodomain and WD repeat-containing protein 1 [Choanephora cucurbitarum]
MLWSKLYYLITKFLAAGPCKDAARVLERELDQHRELLPHTITYEGKQVPMTLDRLSKEYPDISNNYLLELLSNLLSHFKETGDPTVLRANALRHGDRSLFTMLSAFIPSPQVQQCHYMIMPSKQLDKLPIRTLLDRLLIAREMGAKVMKKTEMPTSLSTFYRERVTISGHRNPVYSVVFDKTNRRLFTGSDDFLVKVWCVRTGYLIHTIRGHQNAIADIAINQENTLIATASTDGCVRVWTMDEYKPIFCLRPNSNTIKPFTTVKFSPSPRSDTRYLMATNEDGFVRLWRWDRDTLQFFDLDTPVTFSCRFRARDRLRCSSFNYTGTKFAVAGDDGFVYVFSTLPVQTKLEGTQTEDANRSNNSGRGRRRFANALFPDKNSPLNDQPVVTIGTLEGHRGSVTDLAYSHDGQRILSGSQDGTARIWTLDTQTKEWSSIVLDLKLPLPDTPIVRPSKPHSTAMSRSASYQHLPEPSQELGQLMPPLGTPTEEEPMQVDFMSHEETEEQSPKVSMIAWSADDRWCIVASNQGEIRVYYAYNGQPACILKGHEGEIYALDNHPLDSSTLLSAGYDGNVILWDIQKQKVMTCTHHRGRTFTDCKFSKDATKYAITDEEGHCTLYSLGGLDRDYEQVRSWERGQYFMTDYQALRHFVDGTFVDEPTQQLPYAMAPSPIIDLQGVAYPNQKKLGYGRTIPTQSETFELEDQRRSACYDQEEEEMRRIKLIVLPHLDRATVARNRRDFVKMDDEEEDNSTHATQLFPPPLPPPTLLPDDSEDEDYHDDEQQAAYATSGNSSSDDEDEPGSDDFVSRSSSVRIQEEDEEDGEEGGPVTRSRAGQVPLRTLDPTRHRGRGRGRGRGSQLSRVPTTRGRPSRKRTRGRLESDDDLDEEQPVRARARRRRVAERPSYVESDLEEEEEEDEFVDVDTPQEEIFEAGPSTQPPSSTEDRKGKRRLRSNAAIIQDDDEDDDEEEEQQKKEKEPERRSVYVPSHFRIPSTSTTTEPTPTRRGRLTRSRTANEPTKPIQQRRTGRQRDVPRELSEEEIKEYEPIPWITTTERSLVKYLPQLGDRVAILTEGYKEYLKVSELKSLFDHHRIDRHEPVLFAKVSQIQWQVGPPAYCKLKLSMFELANPQQVVHQQADPVWTTLNRDETIEYTDEDGSPEFIVLWERFRASMTIFKTLKQGQRVDALYDEGQYTGTIAYCNANSMNWKRAGMPSPWAYYHVIWDDPGSNAEDLCPWELVPSGEDFRSHYDVQPSLTVAQIQRARDVIEWLSNTDDFFLYVQQVNYHDYPAYLSVIAYPICLDMVRERLENNFYRSIEGLMDDVELIKKNAQKYNADSSPAHKNAARLANFFKTRIQKPSMPLSLSRGPRKRIIKDDSDDEYDVEAAVSEEEEEEVRRPYDSDDFVRDDSDEDYSDAS